MHSPQTVSTAIVGRIITIIAQLGIESDTLAIDVQCIISCSVDFIITATEVSDEAVEEFLTSLNQQRSEVSPLAAAMFELVSSFFRVLGIIHKLVHVNILYEIVLLQLWNSDLSVIAQYHADQCTYAINDERSSLNANYTNVGEAILVIDADKFNITAIVEKWNSENLYYDFDSNTCHYFCYCGDYLQVHTY